MKLKFLGAFFAVLLVTSSVFAQSLNVGGVRITDESITTGSDRGSVVIDNDSVYVSDERGSVMINNDGVAVNTNSNDQKNCTVNGKSVPCDAMAKGAGLLLLIPIFFALIGFLLFIFWIVTLIHALTRPIQNKIVWVIVIVFVPFGFILYYFIEMRPFNKKMMEAYKMQTATTAKAPDATVKATGMDGEMK